MDRRVTFWFLVTALLLQYSSDAALVASDTFEMESEGYDSRELKLTLAYGLGQAFDDTEFRPRGTITIRNFKGPKYTTQQDKITETELKSMEKGALEDGYYFLSASIKYPNGERVFSSFAPVKSLLASGFSDVLSIHLAPSGEIFSISYSLAGTNYNRVKSTSSSSSSQSYNTTVVVHSGESGPVPDTAPYLEKLEMERLSRERGDEGRDNRSFISKYWMYIVPVALLILLSGASNPEGGS